LCRAAGYWSKGHTDLALADYGEAIRINPKFAAAYAARADARLGASQSEALKAWSPNAPSYTLPAARAYSAPSTDSANVPPPPNDWALAPAGPAPSSVVYPNAPSVMYGAPAIAPSLTPTALAASFRTDSQPPTLAEVDAFRTRVEKYWGTIKRGQEQALADYGEAIRLDPKNAGYRKSRAKIYAALGENEKRLADLSEAIRLDPKDYNALAERCRVYEERGDLDKAIADATDGIRKQTGPSTIYIYSRRASFYGRKGDLDKAIADLTEAIRICPNYRQAYERRAEFYLRLHETEKAAADAAQAARIPTYGAGLSGYGAPYYTPQVAPTSSYGN
jgi:tetratricopeptide (TPR) repeat protein